jgi:hypothetical protein
LKECEDDTHTPKMGTWESSGTFKTLKFDYRGQNTFLAQETQDWCRNPTLAKCGGEAQHLEKVRIWSPLELPNV